MTTVELLADLALKCSIEQYRLVKFPEWKQLQDFLPYNSDTKELLDEALGLVQKVRMPFWDAVLLIATRHKSVDDVIKNADHHNPITDELWIESDTISSFVLDDNIGINSMVRMADGFYLHIPMIDFHLPVSEKNTETVIKICKLLGFEEGGVINSGNSYHFMGHKLVSESKLIDILARSLLYGPITDTRWIAHQILERSCTLRIGKKNGLLPQVITTDL